MGSGDPPPRVERLCSTTEGDPELRALDAARMTARGLATAPDDLLICSGSQQALTLVATALLDPGDVVLVAEPSYLAALQAFQLAGARVVGVPCDEAGLEPDAVARIAARERAKALYLIPTFQNPTGRTLPLERRRALATVAAEQGLWLVEDDPYSELRHRGEPLPPVASLPGAEDRTLTLSTLSKVLAPGCGSAGCAPRRPSAASWWSPSRRPTCTRPRSTRRSPRAGWPPATRRAPGGAPRRLPRAPGHAARRVAGRAGPQPSGGRHVRVGAAARRRRRRAAPARHRPRRRVRAGLSVLRRPAGPAHAAAVVHGPPRRTRSPWVWSGWRPRWSDNVHSP